EKLRSRERAVDDVEVDRHREHQDEERRQREVRDQRPSSRRLAEDLLDARRPRLHGRGSSAFGVTRPTNTSSSEERTGESSWSCAPRARRRSTRTFKCSTSRAVRSKWPLPRSTEAPVPRRSASSASSTPLATSL